MTDNIKKKIVLFALFVVPLLFYIFLQLGTHNFGKLKIQSKDVLNISLIDENFSFKDKVSVVAFAGNDVLKIQTELYNLNEKVYRKFYGYTDFQLIVLVTKGQEKEISELLEKLKINTNTIKWKFVSASKEELSALHHSFKTSTTLSKSANSPKAFIIDKKLNLRRGSSTIKQNEGEKLFGYNMQSVAELKNDMHDDVKILLAEYSFALKKNNTSEQRRQKSISNEKN